jgi:bisanhydrobacterioruberin hydratase
MLQTIQEKGLKFKTRIKETKFFFILFYTVGLIGLILPQTFPLFIKLTPIALILSFVCLIIFHEHKIDRKTVLFFLGVFILSFVIELIGVNTGIVFGHYQYGKGLGFKIFNTPLIIGINWLLLVYASANIVGKFKLNYFFMIIAASSLMLVYDIVLEQLSSKLAMWSWKNHTIPFKNYAAWFIIAFLFNLGIKAFKINTENKISPTIFLCQFMFFVFLYIYFNLIN